MESVTIPLAVYRCMSAVSGHGTASIPFLFSQVCLSQIRLSLYQRGLPESLVLTGSVGMKEDPVLGERSYWLGEEDLLFRAKVVVKSVRHYKQWRDMYCAVLYKPLVLNGPEKSQPHFPVNFRAFTSALQALNEELASSNLRLNIICYDEQEATLGLKQFGQPLSAGNFAAVRQQLLNGLSGYGFNVRLYDYGVGSSQTRMATP